MKRKVVKWGDGDSGWFSDGTQFRLARVRAPEKHQFGGETATRRAAGMTGQTKGFVNSQTLAKDSYGRSLVELSNRHGSINNRLLQRGCKNKGR
jgi:endonuclease YncB( thermonuclease family)